MSSKLTPDTIARACQDLMAGAPIKAVAATAGVSDAHLCKTVHAAGLAHTWTTTAERAALAALRSGTSTVVLKDAAAPVARLAQQIAAALAEYHNKPTQPRPHWNAANRGTAPARPLSA